MSSTIPEGSTSIKIRTIGEVDAVAFSANGEYLMSGDGFDVTVWRVQDGQRMAKLEAYRVRCVAVSKDDRWIAAGTYRGETIIWDGKTYEQVFSHEDTWGITGVDFSPDATRLVAASYNDTATVWDLGGHKQVQTLNHNLGVTAAKYAPQGNRIATAALDSVQVWDTENSWVPLVVIKTQVTPWFNNGLLWFGKYLFVVSGSQIRQFDASTGSGVSEWPVPDSRDTSCTALPKHSEFIAYSTNTSVTFWNTSTHSRLGTIHHPGDIRSIAFSPDDRFLAIGGHDGDIAIKSLYPAPVPASTQEQGMHEGQTSTLAAYEDDSPDSSTVEEELSGPQSVSQINDSMPLFHRDPTFQELDFQIDDDVLDSWKSDQLIKADALLSTAITMSQEPSHHSFASRALVRARLKEWDIALVDAEKAIEIEPSVISYISKSIVLVGKEKKHEGYRACDIAFVLSHSCHVTFLLLVKAIIVFMAGECFDAISRVDDLIGTVPFDPIYYVVQAYMYFLLGNTQMENSDYEAAIQSFKYAGAKMQHHASQSLLVISLISGWKFDDLDVSIRQGLCEALYGASRISDAVKYFNQMKDELGEQTNWHSDYRVWALDFRQRASKKLEYLGDTAMDAQRYDEAISHYTTLLSFNLPPPQGILVKRSKAFMASGSWKQAVDDINQIIALDPSSPWSYEMKYATLHKAGDYGNAVRAFEAMLSKMEQSTVSDIRHRRDQYKAPSGIRTMIRRIVHRTLRNLPSVLINATTGRLHDRAEQASAFESLPIFNELISSMTTRIDRTRVKREVQDYFRYVMLSHKWEDNESLFQHVMQAAVYDLDKSPTNDKLQTFCKIVRDSGFDWAWSDTCCINKSDHFVLQEALVAMFKWYQGAALVIVFLRGVYSSSPRGALVGSIWNTRAWTLQEYIAARVVHFYTEDWTLYLDLQLSNHKESQEVISEMEEATKVSSDQLITLRPGLTSIREKLRLASTRQTTLVEDAAYSLLGIFSVAGISAIYGEGEASLGRLLSHVLAGSGDVSILAWTGDSGGVNSCLPTHISVFNGPATSHIPPTVSDTEMEKFVSLSHTSLDLGVVLTLYDRLRELPAPWFAANRMKLPCIAFELPPLTSYRTRSGRVYRADTTTFGMVEIKTRHDLSRMKSLYLVHPWLDALLEREGIQNVAHVEDEPPPLSPDSDDEEISDNEIDDSSSVLVPELPSLPAPEHVTLPMDRDTRARRLVARLRQPFGALLVALASTGRRSVDYRRVAADSLITVQIQDNVSLTEILDNVRVLDVL